MEGEVLIKVEDLSKKFCRDLKRSLRYGLQDMAGEITGRPRTDSLREKEFWAVKDIGFEVRRGECLGLIGHNGAGKTTLLRMLNGLIKPDQGRIEIRGTVGALIALGAGFNPILTGRENIYVNAAVLGLSKARVDEKLEEILAFAELGEFIDMPVQHYSSGMSVRLGFAVAAILIEPDILFLDEVLAVGDISFTIKCLNRVRELMRTSAVVFVSHNMPLISSFCTRVLVMDHGHTVLDTDQPGVAINHYYGLVSGAQQVSGTGEARVVDVQLVADGMRREGELLVIPQGADTAVELELDTQAVGSDSLLFVHVDDATLTQMITIPTMDDGGEALLLAPGNHRIRVPLGRLELNAGRYTMLVVLKDPVTGVILCRHQGLAPFTIHADRVYWSKFVRPVIATRTHE
jgi:lipopolysaccharide transport system ATP-binding protein